jgi:hypothetical protein
MKNGSLTYGQLYSKLQALSFVSRTIRIDGERTRVFEHKDIPKSMIVLPRPRLQRPGGAVLYEFRPGQSQSIQSFAGK